jgi:hypothetical protein
MGTSGTSAVGGGSGDANSAWTAASLTRNTVVSVPSTRRRCRLYSEREQGGREGVHVLAGER